MEHDARTEDEIAATMFGLPMAQVKDGLAVSGSQLGGLGWVEAATVAGILQTLPLDVARAVLDADTGTQTDLRTDAYRVPTKMKDFVTTRDGTCRMWGCTRPARPLRPRPRQTLARRGSTTPENLVPLCRRHHRLKQLGHWRPALDPDGTLTWTDPTGRTRTTEPLHRLDPPSASPPPPADVLHEIPALIPF